MKALSLVIVLVCFITLIQPSQAINNTFEVCGEGINGYETPCCLYPDSGWQFGFCNSSLGPEGTFVDLCLDFFFGRCRNCIAITECESNIIPTEIDDCIQEETNQVRKDTRANRQNPVRYDDIVRNIQLSNLAVGHSCYWSPDNPQHGSAGDYFEDRKLLVSSDLPFWLANQYDYAGVCPEVVEYDEFYFLGTCDEIYDWLRGVASIRTVVQSGRFKGGVQTSFFGLGVYDTNDVLGPYAITLIWVRTAPVPGNAGTDNCSGPIGPNDE